jgi:alanine dehydrogenase
LPPAVRIEPAGEQALATALQDADVLIGAVNIPGSRTPKLVTRAALRRMGAGSVFIDVSIDGGGVAETSRPTKHSAPTYIEEGVIHYCVPNMPAAVPNSASKALSAAIFPYVKTLADNGLTDALRIDAGLAAGLQVHGGRVTNANVAAALGKAHYDLDALLHAC